MCPSLHRVDLNNRLQASHDIDRYHLETLSTCSIFDPFFRVIGMGQCALQRLIIYSSLHNSIYDTVLLLCSDSLCTSKLSIDYEDTYAM